jgi:hypothetical protein
MSKKIVIYPVKKKAETDNRWDDIKITNLPCHPFNLLLCARPKQGKSNLIVNLLYNPIFDYKKRFDNIIYISPSVMGDKTLENSVAIDDDIVKIHDNLEPLDPIIEAIMGDQLDNKDESLLLILDDLVGNIKGSSIAKLSAKYRHYNMSMIVVSQNYKSFSVLSRNSASQFILFKTHNQKEIDKINEEIGASFGKDFEAIYDVATEEKHNFLCVDVERQQLTRNFNEILLKL